jgi:hypothetical protein
MPATMYWVGSATYTALFRRMHPGTGCIFAGNRSARWLSSTTERSGVLKALNHSHTDIEGRTICVNVCVAKVSKVVHILAIIPIRRRILLIVVIVGLNN